MKKIAGLGDILQQLGTANTLVLQSALAEPAVLGAQLEQYAAELAGTRVFCLMPMGEAGYASAQASQHLAINTFLPGAGLRRAVNDGRATQHSIRLYDISAFFEPARHPVDVLFLQLSPPDENGQMSLGITVDYMPAILAQRPLIVAEINPQMPRTCGDTSISVADVSYAIDVDYLPQTMPTGKADNIDETVAENVTGLLSNNMVLQYGIGTIPELVPVRATHLQGLSIHTGLITDAIIPALRSGAFDNSGHTDYPGKVVTTMAGGSAQLYAYLDNNPDVHFKPTSYTHSRQVLQRTDRLVAINSVLQIDLHGRANAERAAGRVISGPGGLFDFARGATESNGGISILAMRSTTRRGDQSCIVASLAADAPVTVAGEHLDYIVTEYGVAHVRDKRAAQLARELIAVAHPDFRATLRAASDS